MKNVDKPIGCDIREAYKVTFSTIFFNVSDGKTFFFLKFNIDECILMNSIDSSLC